MMIPCHTHPVSSGQKSGGKGTAEVLSVIDPSVFQGQNQMLARVVLQPGCSIGCHATAETAKYIIFCQVPDPIPITEPSSRSMRAIPHSVLTVNHTVWKIQEMSLWFL